MTFASLLIAVALMFPSQPETPRPVVVISDGLVMGRAEADVLAFKGIPYAAPPLGPCAGSRRNPFRAGTSPAMPGVSEPCAFSLHQAVIRGSVRCP